MTELIALPYLHGEPQSTGDLRTSPEDFKVFECIPFIPCGEGEHLIIYIRKTGVNTIFVARQLAKYFKVREGLVSYAGLKDRSAVTEQYFNVHVPGKTEYDLSDMDIPGVEVLSYKRHNKKLKTGGLTGNRFELTLRNVSDIDDVVARWEQINKVGVPNYFGEQRFGIEGNNIAAAGELFNGKKVKDKKKRSFYLSAARSYIFNAVVAQRITQGCFSTPIQGDVFMLSGSNSVFAGEEINEQILARMANQDIDITAPLWGAGELLTQASALELESNVGNEHQLFAQGLGRFGLKQERRNITLSMQNAKLQVVENNVFVSFFLPPGCFATTVLRELLNYQDIAATNRLPTEP